MLLRIRAIHALHLVRRGLENVLKLHLSVVVVRKHLVVTGRVSVISIGPFLCLFVTGLALIFGVFLCVRRSSSASYAYEVSLTGTVLRRFVQRIASLSIAQLIKSILVKLIILAGRTAIVSHAHLSFLEALLHLQIMRSAFNFLMIYVGNIFSVVRKTAYSLLEGALAFYEGGIEQMVSFLALIKSRLHT